MASTDNSTGNSGSKCANTAAADVRVHFTAQTAFSYLCDQFQDLLHAAKHVSNDNYSHFTGTIRQVWIASALSKCANKAAADVRAHFTAQTAFSHLCGQFQGVFPMSPYRG